MYRSSSAPAIFWLALCLAGCVTTSGVAVEVRWYRYALELRSGDMRYVQPVEPGTVEGRRYRVETDARGRITRVSTFIGARQTGETRYSFDGAEPWPSRYQVLAADGEPTTIVTIQRDEQGRRTRQEFRLLEGRLTNYRIRTYADERVESVQYSATDKREGRTRLVYTDDDVLLRSRWFPTDGPTHYEIAFDPQTGLSKGRKRYRRGALDAFSRDIYDAGGLRTRSIHYDAAGRRYGATDFADGLKVVSHLDFADGSFLEVRFAHDQKRRTREAVYAYNGRPVFALSYERLPNGRTVRTVARGPDGDVWAEYPNLYVEYVERNGEVVDQPGAAKIYRKEPWWPALATLRADRPPPARRETAGAPGWVGSQCIR